MFRAAPRLQSLLSQLPPSATRRNMATTTNGHNNGNAAAAPKITLYTNHGCPYAQRAHITLDELKLPYEEVLIDLGTPRPQWYLDINPRGLVPSIKYSVPGVYDEEIITESAIVAQFLADSFPSHLLPGTRDSPDAPLKRARIGFFVDTWSTKVGPNWFQVIRADSPSEKQEKVTEWVAIVKKEIEPLLAGANPFFGGSDKLTFAEVIAGPFVLRFYALANDGELIPKSLVEQFDALPNFGKWAKAVREHPTVTKVWDEKEVVEGAKKMAAKFKAAAK